MAPGSGTHRRDGRRWRIRVLGIRGGEVTKCPPKKNSHQLIGVSWSDDRPVHSRIPGVRRGKGFAQPSSGGSCLLSAQPAMGIQHCCQSTTAQHSIDCAVTQNNKTLFTNRFLTQSGAFAP